MADVTVHLTYGREVRIQKDDLCLAREVAAVILRDGVWVKNDDGSETLFPPISIHKITVTPSRAQR